MHTRVVRILGIVVLVMSFAGAAVAADGANRVDDNPSISDEVANVVPTTPTTTDAMGLPGDTPTAPLTVEDPDDATTTVAVDDPDDDVVSAAGAVSGPCDEVEHADDAACADITVDDPDDDLVSAAGAVSGPCDEVEHAEDPRCTDVSVDDATMGSDHQTSEQETAQLTDDGGGHRGGARHDGAADDGAAADGGTSGRRGDD